MALSSAERDISSGLSRIGGPGDRDEELEEAPELRLGDDAKDDDIVDDDIVIDIWDEGSDSESGVVDGVINIDSDELESDDIAPV
jgi:hypothetical protein